MEDILDRKYQGLLFDIIKDGIDKDTRNGRTRSVFGKQIRHKMKDGFPLLTTKKMYWKGIVTELIWFLRGDTNIKFLVDNGVHIWDGDAYKNYVKAAEMEFSTIDFGVMSKEEFINKIKTDFKFAEKWGDLGPVYGKQWRLWGGFDKEPSGWQYGAVVEFKKIPICDQIQNLIDDLKTNPDSRRLMVTAWNPGELDQMVLPPCHYGFQVYTRELSLRERNNFLGDKKYAMLDGDYIWPTMIEDKEKYEKIFNETNTPTKLITITYNDKTIESYE